MGKQSAVNARRDKALPPSDTRRPFATPERQNENIHRHKTGPQRTHDARAAYNDFRGWTLPADECGADDGYLVEYLDGGKPNTATHAGYVSWSPKAQHEAAYRETNGMSFGLAIEAMKKGQRVARAGWNGKGMWVDYFQPMHSVDLPYLRMSYPVHSSAYPNGARVPWLASQTDMLADDWAILP